MAYTVLSHLYYQNKDGYEELYRQRIASESTCFLGIKIHENDAFFSLCPDIYTLTSEILSLDKKVALLCEELPGVALMQFANKCLIDEIKLSNDIEHINSTRKELTAMLEKIHTGKTGERFYGLVKKYSMLSQESFSLKSCADIRNIYDELVLTEVVAAAPDNAPDGTVFRKGMAEVTSETQKVIHHGAYPETKIIQLMEQALHIVNDNAIPALIRIALFHYLFGYIHPFYDGNGRTSRFISSYLLAQEFETLIGYRLSYTIKENLNKYYKAFQDCNDEKNRGDLTPFVIMFLAVVRESFENLFMALTKRNNALTHYRELVQTLPYCTDEKLFCDILLQATLFSEKGIPKKELCEVLTVSPSTTDKRLAKLRHARLLVEQKEERAYHYSLDLDRLREMSE